VEVVITMASSGTMCSEKVRANSTPDQVTGDVLFGGRPDPTCAHFNTMKKGVREFVTSLHENVTVGSLKVGLVPYNHKVRLPDTNKIPPTLAANESAQYYRDLRDAEPLSPTLALTSDTGAVLRAIDAMQQTPDGLAWGRSDLASHVAGLMLEPENHQYFATGEVPAAFGSAKKAVIIMTDGANIGCCFTNWKPGNFNNQYVYFYPPYNQSQMAICESLKAQGVKIFSILLDVKDTDPGGKQINNTFARCASGAYGEGATPPAGDLKCKDKQYCFNVSTDADLLKVYRQIAQSFYQPKISQ
jgi:hypothetical protein